MAKTGFKIAPPLREWPVMRDIFCAAPTAAPLHLGTRERLFTRDILCTASTAAPLMLVPAGINSSELKAAMQAVSLARSWSGVEFSDKIN
jgi:hypothetical protein